MPPKKRKSANSTRSNEKPQNKTSPSPSSHRLTRLSNKINLLNVNNSSSNENLSSKESSSKKPKQILLNPIKNNKQVLDTPKTENISNSKLRLIQIQIPVKRKLDLKEVDLESSLTKKSLRSFNCDCDNYNSSITIRKKYKKTKIDNKNSQLNSFSTKDKIIHESHSFNQINGRLNGNNLEMYINNNELWNNWPISYTDSSDPSLSRIWRDVDFNVCSLSDQNFSVMTYNILSETLLKNSHYFSNIKPSDWNRSQRHELLLKEIKHFMPTIICMQEVDLDYFDTYLHASLKSLGFCCHFNTNIEKTHGLMLGFSNERFIMRHFESFVPSLTVLDRCPMVGTSDCVNRCRDYLNVPEIAQICILEDIMSYEKRLLCIANIHITYAQHKKLDLRCIQATETLWKILETNRKFQSPISWIFCGDFNSTPSSMLYQIVRDGYPNEETINQLSAQSIIPIESQTNNRECLFNVVWPAFQHPFSGVRSMYADVMKREPPLTMHLKGNSGCLDYIWMSQKGIKPLKILLPPSEYLRDRLDALPDINMPSDHSSLMGIFAWE